MYIFHMSIDAVFVEIFFTIFTLNLLWRTCFWTVTYNIFIMKTFLYKNNKTIIMKRKVLFKSNVLIYVMTMSQMILVAGLIFEKSVTMTALNWGRVSMLVLFVSVYGVFVDEF